MKQYCKTFSKWDNSDYDVSSQLNMYLKKHPPLNEMAYSRSWVVDRLKSLSTPIINHTMKCVVYKDTTNNFNHWINEIADYFDEVNSTIVKTKNGKLKEEVKYNL